MRGIKDAERGLLEVLAESEEIGPRDLRRRVLTDSEEGEERLDASEVSLAFWRLLNRGEIVLTDQMTIRRAEPQPAG